LATASHQAFSSNLYTLVSDMFPKASVGSVAGFGGTAGYVGASIFQIFVGYMVQSAGNYTLPFIIAGSAYLIAFAVIHALAPNIKPATEKA
jgi:ACS family hexuronate transporter-like MFS transporter